jgi:hypothetical protein
MLSRRELLMSGALASRVRPAEAGQQPQQQRRTQDPNDAAIDGDLKDIRDAVREVSRLTPSADITLIQERQRFHFKANQRFPSYIEVGLQVWQRLFMWHLENHLPLKAGQTPDGRMGLEFMFTTLILKPELPDTMVGNPYD